MTNFKDYLNEQLQQNPELREEYDALEPEFSFMQAMIDARRETGITQKQLAERTGISQGDINKFESGGGNPSIRTVKRIAAGLGMRVKIEFQPMTWV
ncbi:MAG: helix-turn-helix domain-containing protein [Clostridiales bacterium]|nr:helix-turn-helix domain-containing protein [Clostridiales bacterium]